MTMSEEEFKKLSFEEREKVLAGLRMEKDFKNLPNKDRENILTLLKAEKDPMTQTEASIRGLAQGVGFGFPDEIVAGLSAAGQSFIQGKEFAPLYEKALEKQRSRDKLAAEKFPKSFMGSEVAGAVGISLVPVVGQTGRIGQLGAVAKGALGAGKAAAGGALTALGKAEDKTLEEAKKGALIGGVTGAAASTLGPVARFMAKGALKSPRTVSAVISGGKSEVVRAALDKIKKGLPAQEAVAQRVDALAKILETPASKLEKGAVKFVDALGNAFEKEGAAGLVTAHAMLMERPEYTEFLDRIEKTKGLTAPKKGRK